MAITSDTMYNTRTVVPTFMSANLYYDYRPYFRKENQLNGILEHTEIMKPQVSNRHSCDTAMEIDDNGSDYSIASCCSNNDSMILEASVQNRLKLNDKQFQQQAVYNTDSLQRRNRKRCNGDLNPTSQLKKFRRGGGKDQVYQGTESTKDYGSTSQSYESEALRVFNVDNNMKRSMITNNNCWATDDRGLLNNSDRKQLLSNSGHKPVENNIEYEKILFETHGCSMYQFHRLQLVGSDCTEAEF